MMVLHLLFTALAIPTGPVERLGGAAELAPGAARRIVSLAPSLTEILFAIGAGERVVGVTRFCDWPEAARALPKVGGFVDPDPEAVLTLRPDVVVTAPARGARERIDRLVRLGASVVVVPTEGLDDLWQAVDALGTLTGRREAATALATSLRRELDELRRETARSRRLRVVLIVGHRPLVAAGPGSYLDALLSHLNAENALSRSGTFVHVDLEVIAAAKPDVIVDLSFGEPPPPGYWERLRPVMGSLMPRVARLTDEAAVRPGPRLPTGLRALAAAVRPAP